MPKKILIPRGIPGSKKIAKTYPFAGRVNKATYDTLKELLSQTFLTPSQVIGELITFATEHVEVVGADIYFKNKR